MQRWLDWRPIVGCSPISPGCANCAGIAGAPADVTREHAGVGRVWTGALRLDALALPLPASLPLPAIVTVCANGDLFHEGAPTAWIDSVFDVIDAVGRHTYRVLTKRADRMRAYIEARYPAGAPKRVELGISAERQAEAVTRLTELAATPAARRFATFYPLLGPIDARPWLRSLDYVGAGEEPERPADPAWFLDLAADCAVAWVPFVRCDRVLA